MPGFRRVEIRAGRLRELALNRTVEGSLRVYGFLAMLSVLDDLLHDDPHSEGGGLEMGGGGERGREGGMECRVIILDVVRGGGTGSVAILYQNLNLLRKELLCNDRVL